MKENKYDDQIFFDKYQEMPRSRYGLEAAGEWHALRAMLPPLAGQRVLDLGCGFGWHCRYASGEGASSVTGVDISGNMLEAAKQKTSQKNITYIQSAIEDLDFQPGSFDVILSSLTFHYIDDFGQTVKNIRSWLVTGGHFIFSVEHPVFTAQGKQDWVYYDDGTISHWPVDNYFYPGKREAVFLGERVIKYHRSLDNYIKALLYGGFTIADLTEPEPPTEMLESIPGMADELRRPMMLIISALKQ